VRKLKFILFLVFILWPICFVQAGENSIQAEKIIRNNQQTLVFRLRTKKALQIGEKTAFSLSVFEQPGEKKIEKGQMSLEIKNGMGELETFVTAEEKEKGVYSFSYIFNNSDDYRLIISFSAKEQKKTVAGFVLTLGSKKSLTKIYLLDLLFLSAVTLILFFYRQRIFSLKVKIVIILMVLNLIIINHLQQNKKDFIAELKAEKSKDEQFFIPKETQLIFGINTEIIAEKVIGKGITINGEIKIPPQSISQVESAVSGRIILPEITLGANVKKDQVIGYLEQTLGIPEKVAVETALIDLQSKIIALESTIAPTEKRINVAKNALLRAKNDLQNKEKQLKAELEKSKTKLNNLNLEKARVLKLAEVGATSQKKEQEINMQFRVAELELQALEKEINYIIGAEALKRIREGEIQVSTIAQELEISKVQLAFLRKKQKNFTLAEKIILKAPIGGVVTEINTTNGKQVQANEHLLTISNPDKLLLEADVFEQDLAKITSAKKASFNLAAYPGEVFRIGQDKDNRLLTMGISVNQEKKTIPIIYEIKNPERKFKEGMFAQITIETSSENKKMTVPKKAISSENGEKVVYVFLGGETFFQRKIKTGSEGQNYVEVLSGLNLGERVVTDGLYQVNSFFVGKN